MKENNKFKIFKVDELVEMYKNGELIVEREGDSKGGTQRNFLYSNESFEIETLSRSAFLIDTIREHEITLPSIYLFKIDGEDGYYLLDGKQRFLSFYYYIKSDEKFGGRGYDSFPKLELEEQKRIRNLELIAIMESGDRERMELIFDRLSRTAIPLEDYEILRGIRYGTFIYGLENFYNSNQDILGKPHLRGKDYFEFLGFLRACKERDVVTKYHNLVGYTFPIRNNEFKKVYGESFLEEIIEELKLLINFAKLKKDVAYEVISTMYSRGHRITNILGDKNSTKFGRFEEFIKYSKPNTELILTYLIKTREGVDLDSRRFFDPEMIEKMYRELAVASPDHKVKCQCGDPTCSDIVTIKNIEGDHDMPWSKGGMTNSQNLKLLTKKHNARKGNRDKENLKVWKEQN